jgi:hypothetical protein
MRRWQFLVVISVLAAGSLAAGLVVASHNGSSAPRTTGPTPPHAVVLRGDGVGAAEFGQPEATAMMGLRATLGAPQSDKPVSLAGNCTIDSAAEWPIMTAYFFHGNFVGYATRSLLGTSHTRVMPDAATAAGLHVGDPLTRAAQLYGGSLQTSYAQGGSWVATTSSGNLAGFLTSEVNSTKPAPRIADVTAGAVGCPAASP